MNNKSKYVKPELKAHGSVEKLTHGGTTGRKLDADYSMGTDFGDLTFS